MEKLFHFDSPREKYHCDAAVVSCFDNRFELAFRKFIRRIGVLTPDPIKIAGGAKTLASPARQSDQEYVLEQIQKSIDLHHTKRVILMLHSDCGAYGGLARFEGDVRREAEHHASELRRAADRLHAAIPGLEVQAFFVDFEGIWLVDLKRAAAGESTARPFTVAAQGR